MYRKLLFVGIILLGFAIQTTLFQTLQMGSISPNILIIITASIGFMYGKKAGMLAGFLCGLLSDIFFGSTLGMYAMIYMYLGYGNGFMKRIFYPEDVKLPLVMIAGSDLAYSFLTYFLLYLFRGRFQIGHYIIHIILPELVYTLLITIVVYPLLLMLNKQLSNYDHKRG